MALSTKQRQALHAHKRTMRLELSQRTCEQILSIQAVPLFSERETEQKLERWDRILEVMTNYSEQLKNIHALTYEEWRSNFL